MLLWSFGRLDVAVDPDVLAALVHHVTRRIQDYETTAVIVTCVAFARLVFARRQFW